MLRVHYPESEPTTHPHHQQVKKGTHGVHVHNRTTVHHVTAAIAAGKHPAPSRTRKLSQPAPMVLHPRGCGRVGRRRTTTHPMGAITRWPPSAISAAIPGELFGFGGRATSRPHLGFAPAPSTGARG